MGLMQKFDLYQNLLVDHQAATTFFTSTNNEYAISHLHHGPYIFANATA